MRSLTHRMREEQELGSTSRATSLKLQNKRENLEFTKSNAEHDSSHRSAMEEHEARNTASARPAMPSHHSLEPSTSSPLQINAEERGLVGSEALWRAQRGSRSSFVPPSLRRNANWEEEK